ncbi:hypothetical protein ACIRQP_14940 [Streptomyces sp. NPDC102274]|uniref:hypothetical protein n=1 Tax=Streptomyces sp. NPDC102274 TaxID=3366151 RepID=UPI00381DEC75
MNDDMTTADLFTGDELYEMDQADEARLDAEDDAHNTAAVEAEEADDGEPWLGLADGEER